MIDKLAAGKPSKLQDVYEIEKTDKFLSKSDYRYILENMPLAPADRFDRRRWPGMWPRMAVRCSLRKESGQGWGRHGTG